ncbi:MAG: YSC84-related protein [Kofleriaceae bacterium]
MMKLIAIIALLTPASFFACATAPKTVEERQSLEQQARTTLQEMLVRDPGLEGLLDAAAGYVVFPDVGKAAAVVGGAWGRGVLFENGRPSGFVELSQGSIGAQVGGQSMSELVVLRDRYAVARLKNEPFELGANASAVAIKAGAAASATFADGVAVFQLPRGGLMVEVSVAGQKLNFEPSG